MNTPASPKPARTKLGHLGSHVMLCCLIALLGGCASAAQRFEQDVEQRLKRGRGRYVLAHNADLASRRFEHIGPGPFFDVRKYLLRAT